MSMTEHAKLLRARYKNSDLHRIQAQAQLGGFKELSAAVTLALQIIG